MSSALSRYLPYPAQTTAVVACLAASATLSGSGVAHGEPPSAAPMAAPAFAPADPLAGIAKDKPAAVLVCQQSAICDASHTVLRSVAQTPWKVADSWRQQPDWDIVVLDAAQSADVASSVGLRSPHALIWVEPTKPGAPRSPLSTQAVMDSTDVVDATKVREWVAANMAASSATPGARTGIEPVPITSANLDTVMRRSDRELVVLAFHTVECPMCAKVNTDLTAVVNASDTPITLGTVDSMEEEDLISRFAPSGYPSLMAISQGSVIMRKLGYDGSINTMTAWLHEARTKHAHSTGQQPPAAPTTITAERTPTTRSAQPNTMYGGLGGALGKVTTTGAIFDGNVLYSCGNQRLF